MKNGYSKMEYERRSAHVQMRNMDRIQGFKLFIRVVDLGSFSKAAAEMGMSQSSATKQVAQLETRLGSRLLHRSTHGVTPTEIGLLFYEKCKLIAYHIDEADSAAALMQSQVQGSLRISTSVAFGRRVLSPLVMGFMRAHPKVHVELNFEDRYVNLVEQGVDVAVRMGRLADSTLGSRYLGLNPWVLVAAPEYLQVHAAPNAPQDLAQHHALIYSSVQGDARWVFSGSDGQTQVVTVQGPLRSNNLSALLAAARGGLGVAALPWYVAYESVHAGALQVLLPDWALPSQEIHAVFPSPRLVPTKVTQFIAWLQEHMVPQWWLHKR